MLNVPEHLMVPSSVLEWLARNMLYGGGGVFMHGNKMIKLNKEMVDKVFGFPGGTVPYILSSQDPEIVKEVETIRKQYLQGNKIPIKHLEGILMGTNDELVFIRSLILYFITTILCPATYNFVRSKYLFSLRDSDLVNVGSIDFGSLCLTHLSDEIDTWMNKVGMNPQEPMKSSWIGGCLPLWGVCLFFHMCLYFCFLLLFVFHIVFLSYVFM
jgi:hypothetical protein